MILEGPLSVEQVRTLRKTVDVYYANGLSIAREWPRKPRQPNSPAQINARNAMKSSIAWEKLIPYPLMQLYRSLDTPPTASYRDMMRKVTMTIAVNHSLPLPPLVSSFTAYYVPAFDRTEVLVDYDDYPGFDDTTFLWSYMDVVENGPRGFRMTQLPGPCVRGAAIRYLYRWTLSGWYNVDHVGHFTASNFYRLYIPGYHLPLALTVRHPSGLFDDCPYGPPYEQ